MIDEDLTDLAILLQAAALVVGILVLSPFGVALGAAAYVWRRRRG